MSELKNINLLKFRQWNIPQLKNINFLKFRQWNMPQLNYTLLFYQIFWSILIFTNLCFILLHIIVFFVHTILQFGIAILPASIFIWLACSCLNDALDEYESFKT